MSYQKWVIYVINLSCANVETFFSILRLSQLFPKGLLHILVADQRAPTTFNFSITIWPSLRSIPKRKLKIRPPKQNRIFKTLRFGRRSRTESPNIRLSRSNNRILGHHIWSIFGHICVILSTNNIFTHVISFIT